MTNLTILTNKIRTLDNLYSLNDLHFASGNDPKHRPTFFIKNQQTQDLITEIERSTNVCFAQNSDLQICRTVKTDRCENSHIALKVIKGGRNPELQGTWACEELALAYATWISPKFHLVVLRAFIAMHKGEVQNSQPTLPLAEPKPDIVISYDDAYWIAKYLIRARAFGKEVETFQRQLFETIGLPRYAGRNDLAAKGYDLANEFNHKLDPFIEQIFPQTAKVKRLVHTNF